MEAVRSEMEAMEADRLLYQAKRQKNCVAYKRI